MPPLNKYPATTPKLRKAYKTAKLIADHAPIKTKIMCPCGCLQSFYKKTESHSFQQDPKNNHKNRYYSRTRSKRNPPYTTEMFKIQETMNAYISNYKKNNPEFSVKKKNPTVKVSIFPVGDPSTKDGAIKLMEQNKAISRNAKVGSKILCSCGCNLTTHKSSYQQVFIQGNDHQHKNDYWNKIRDGFVITPELEKSFSAMKAHVDNYVLKHKEKPVLQVKNKGAKRSSRPR